MYADTSHKHIDSTRIYADTWIDVYMRIYIDTHALTHIATFMQIYWLKIAICRHWIGDLRPVT